MQHTERFVMNKSYQFVSESLNLQEGAMGTASAVASGLLAIGAWVLNKKIRTMKVLNRYPTPDKLKKKLETCPDQNVRRVAATLTPNMDLIDYKYWVEKNVNPKLGIGKAILLYLFAPITVPWQGGKAIVHVGEDGETIVDRAIKNKYGMFNM